MMLGGQTEGEEQGGILSMPPIQQDLKPEQAQRVYSRRSAQWRLMTHD